MTLEEVRTTWSSKDRDNMIEWKGLVWHKDAELDEPHALECIVLVTKGMFEKLSYRDMQALANSRLKLDLSTVEEWADDKTKKRLRLP